MTVMLSALVRCNGCGAAAIVDESNLHAREAHMVMGQRGWRWDTDGRDWCPGCQDHLPKRKLNA